MKLLLLYLIIALANNSIAQSVDELNRSIDSLNVEKKKTISKIDSLNTDLTEINNQLKFLSEKRNYIEILNEFNSGFYVKINNSSAVLRYSPSVQSDVLTNLNAGDSVIIFSWYEKPFYKAKYDNKVGYISGYFLESNEKLKAIIINGEKDRIVREKALSNLVESMITHGGIDRVDKERAEKLVREFGDVVAVKILNQQYWLGMTSEMAKESLGSPTDINSSNGSWGNSEQWVYESSGVYLYFKNGILESVQN